MKKFILITTSVLSMFTLAACSNDDKGTDNNIVEEYDVSDKMIHLDHNDLDSLDSLISRCEIEVEDTPDDVITLESEPCLEEDFSYLIYVYTDWCPYCAAAKDVVFEMFEEINYEKVFFLHRDHLYKTPDNKTEEYKDLTRDEIQEANRQLAMDTLNNDYTEIKLENLLVPHAITVSYNNSLDLNVITDSGYSFIIEDSTPDPERIYVDEVIQRYVDSKK